MKSAAVIFCFIPWIVAAVVRLAHVLDGNHTPASVLPFVWLMISPAVTGLGLFVAHTEGRRAAIAKARGE